VLGNLLLDILDGELQLVGRQLLGTAPEALTQQFLDQSAQLVVLYRQLGDPRVALHGRREDIAKHALQHGLGAHGNGSTFAHES
jgi:hypothetical protein